MGRIKNDKGLEGIGKSEERAKLTRKSRRAIRDSKRRLDEGVTIYRGEEARKLAEKCGYHPPASRKKNSRKFYLFDLGLR